MVAWGIAALRGLPQWLSGEEYACKAGVQVRSPRWEDPLEKEMATRSSILVWEIPWTEGPAVHGSRRVGHDERLKHAHSCAALGRAPRSLLPCPRQQPAWTAVGSGEARGPRSRLLGAALTFCTRAVFSVDE